jgi:hypothetical protein
MIDDHVERKMILNENDSLSEMSCSGTLCALNIGREKIPFTLLYCE